MEFKNSGGAWTGFGSGGGSGTVTSVATDTTLTGGPITTTGTLGINLGHANAWTAAQTVTLAATAVVDAGEFYSDRGTATAANPTFYETFRTGKTTSSYGIALGYGTRNTGTLAYNYIQGTGGDRMVFLNGGTAIANAFMSADTSGNVQIGGTIDFVNSISGIQFNGQVLFVGVKSLPNTAAGPTIFGGTALSGGSTGDMVFQMRTLSGKLYGWINTAGTASIMTLGDLGLTAKVPIISTAGARTSGVLSYDTVTAPADTGITTATESIGVNFNLSATRTWVDGTVATQREFLIQAPTYAKTTTSATFTKAATFAITGAPAAGTGVTITNAYALWVQGGKSQFDGLVSILAGATASKSALVGGKIKEFYTDVGNTTTTETDLYTYTTEASILGTNGDTIEGEFGGIFVSSGTATREVKLYFAGTVIFDTGALTLSLSSAWTMYVTIIRVSATVVRYIISFTTEGAALAAYTAVGELTGLTLSNTNVLKITGQAAGVGAATNDIVAKMGAVYWNPVSV